MSEDPGSCSSDDPSRSPDHPEKSATGAAIDVSMPARCWSRVLGDAPELCRQAAAATLAVVPGKQAAGKARAGRCVEVGIALSDDATLRRLNRTYRGNDRPTNVLAFSAVEGEAIPARPEAPAMLGDVILACETVQREADEQGKPLGDHLQHLVVHGVLHLLGYDHEGPAEAQEMEALERRILAELGVADPYAEPARGPVEARP